MIDKADLVRISRRDFIATATGVAVAATLQTPARAQTAATPFTRVSVSDPAATALLQDYQTAITALLKLPPENALNWYRNAFIHTLDCPHGNWWFLPWHRG
ncbi:MAG: hypothetical protein JO093_11000 [Acidobacteria bacterium]|nr:hypothetical protein [Acidobacteriota bacterium]MBV9068379.1 hypothetical protein [Acidobacteriota bacterium]MBV9186145.1 hypothetical protein [Acidobacteriota bacterium]